jgi:leader peptidase (prepilin peptidase) / N-methyltransferase
VAVGVAAGSLAGWRIRLLLARLRRGVVVRPGPLEAGAALLTGLGIGLSWPGPTTTLVVWAGLLGVALGAVDIAAHRLPDALTLPAIPLTTAIVLATDLGAPDSGSVLTAAAMAAAMTAVFGALATMVPLAMGWGDVKLVPSLAMMTGYLSVTASVLAMLIAFVLAAAGAVIGLLVRRVTLTSAIPFGPFLLAGCWLVLAVPRLLTVLIG